MKGFVDFLSHLVNFLIVIGVVLVAILAYVNYEINADGPLSKDKIISIPEGSGVIKIASILEDEGVIDRPLFFRAAAKIADSETSLRFGDYEIPQKASMREVIDILAEGKSVELSVTIPEGWTSYQIVQKINELPETEGTITEVPPEGSLAPNTYNFLRGEDKQVILQRMMDAQSAILKQAWENRDPELPLKSPEELLILASIVEKETGVGEERPLVASVFVNRLNQGMKLQTDPTVIYGITRGEGTLGRGLRRSELDAETPYNTYIIPGLPVGPIANPGRAAIEATANPAKTDYVFFVADGTGGHAFAKTLNEHNENVAKWRQIEAEAAAAAE